MRLEHGVHGSNHRAGVCRGGHGSCFTGKVDLLALSLYCRSVYWFYCTSQLSLRQRCDSYVLIIVNDLGAIPSESCWEMKHLAIV